MTPAAAWVTLGDTVLSERSQSQRDRYCVSPPPSGTWVVTFREAGGGTGWGLHRHRVPVWGDEKVLEKELDGEGFTTL